MYSCLKFPTPDCCKPNVLAKFWRLHETARELSPEQIVVESMAFFAMRAASFRRICYAARQTGKHWQQSRHRSTSAPQHVSAASVPRITLVLGGAGFVPFLWYGWQIEESKGKDARPSMDAVLDRWHKNFPALDPILNLGRCGNGREGEIFARQAFLSYSAVILSFLGGVHWGAAAMTAPPVGGRASQYIISVLPSLVSWASMNVAKGGHGSDHEVGVAARMQTIGFLGMWIADEMAANKHQLPKWYSFVRTPLTGAVVGMHMLASWKLKPSDVQ